MKKTVIAQARMTSHRLPGKVAKDICGKPALYRMIERIRLSRHKDLDIVIATTTNHEDDIVEKIALESGVKVFRGSEDHVLSRYYLAAKENGADIISRVTCDDLFYDPRWLFDDLLDEFVEDGTYDYYTSRRYIPEENAWIDTEPSNGCGVEIFTFKAIERCMFEAKDPYCIEHVTPYLYMNPDIFHVGGHGSDYHGPSILPDKFGTSLDTKEDLQQIRNVYEALYPNDPQFTIPDIIRCLCEHPDWQELITGISRTPVTYHGEDNKGTKW